jgi:uncharacterized protein YegL
MNLSWLSIGQPWVLWGLAVCPLLAAMAWRNRLDATRAQVLVATTARVVTAALLVLAISDARVRWPTRALAVAFVADRSASISPRETAAVRAAMPQRRIDRDGARWLDLAAPGRAGGLETDLEGAIDLAVGILPTDRVRHLVLATDGRETRGEALAAAARARRAGVRVFVLPQGDRAPIDAVAVSGVEVPRLARAGREVSASVRLFAAGERRVTLRALRDGVEVARREVDAPAGQSLHDVAVMLPDEGVHALTFTAETAGDAVAENNTWRAFVRVVPPPRVLLVNELPGVSPALGAVYRDAHLAVDEVHPDGVPSDAGGFERYQFVVLDEVVLTSLTEAQQRALRQWVEERGGGLLTTTGMHGVGREPELIRDIEPIQPPRAMAEPRPVELILVIDRSGSMMGPPIVQARNAGVAAVRALRPDSRVGVVAFSGEVDLVVPPVAMGESESVTRAIGGIRAGGGTNLGAALEAAARIVSRDDRYLHHVILLSDGESRGPPAVAAAQALRDMGATVTAITLGPRVALMGEIARIGRGRYHVTSRPTSLPALFVREAQFRSPPPARELSFRPVVRARMGFLDGVDPSSDPPLLGYTVAQPRPGALTLLTATDGSPLLSHWFVGPGQVASLTSATSGRWADAWRTGAGFRRLFGQMAWEMLRAQGEDDLELHLEAVPGRPDLRRVSVVTPSTRSDVVPVASLSYGRREGVRVALRPAAPGVWTATVPMEKGFVVDARMPASREPSAAAGAESPYPPELRAFGADAPALAALARAGGGRVIRSLDESLDVARGERVMRDARLPLLAAALVAYLLGVLALRVRAGSSARPNPSPPGAPS